MLEARGEVWASESTLRLIRPRTSFPSVATGDRKWVDVSIKEQSLVAYVGRRPVYATLVSSGRGGMGEPEQQATVRGSFMIYQKDVASTMDGEDDSAADSIALHDVPFVQYFHSGFALHGTYWHDEFGKIRSHGCINLSPIDAAWLFEWTDPPVPPDWHGVINKERGTVVYVRP
jgi:lipoprotein-anchoring transpeptidase ErfK/SrfK